MMVEYQVSLQEHHVSWELLFLQLTLNNGICHSGILFILLFLDWNNSNRKGRSTIFGEHERNLDNRKDVLVVVTKASGS